MTPVGDDEIEDELGRPRNSARCTDLTRIAEPDTEIELIALAATCTANDLAKAVASWAAGHLDPADIAARQHDNRYCSWRTDPDGMITITARLEPAVAGQVIAAIDTTVMTSRDAPAGASAGQQRADTLATLVTGGGAKFHAEVLLNVCERPDGTISACLTDGTPVPGPGYSDLYNHAYLRLLIRDAHGHPIDATNRRRHPTTRQKRVVQARAGWTCDQPGCNARTFLQTHHTTPYQDSGHTVTDELRLKCALHHREHHQRAA